MTDNEKVIRDFVNAWSSLDTDRVVEFFTEDGIYHNMPIEPVAGKPQLRGFISAFLKDWSSANWEILNLVSRGDLVIAERVDRMQVNGRPVALPVCGVFEMQGGKIKAWRDYFDMGAYMRAIAPPS